MSTTFGEVSWNDEVPGEFKNTRDLFLRLDEGSNEMRLITQPFQYLVHRYKKEGDPGFGQKVMCSGAHGNCPLCDSGDKAKPRWLLGVISRKTGTYKILDISQAVFSQIRKYAKNLQRWGDPSKYDIDIVVDKAGGPTGYYAVQPIPKEPLSAADQLIKDSVDFEDLKRRVTPPTPEMVLKRIEKINGEGSSSTPTFAPNVKSASAKPASKPVKVPTKQVAVEEDDADEEFPSYNG